MNKILILGASGLLGKSLVRHFTLKGFNVGALSRNTNDFDNKVETYNVNILDYNKLESVILQYNVVINCTGQITNPIHDCLSLNTIGIQNIIKAVKKHNTYLVHLSTVAVYGESNKIITENSELNPQSVYGCVKYFSEFQIQNTLREYSILRVSNLYGENQTKGILGYILRTYKNKEKKLYFNNDGSLKRYYLDINQLSLIIEEIILKKCLGVYNIIGEDFLTIKELIKLCENKLNYLFEVFYEDFKPIENIYLIDDKKIKSCIEYEANYSVEKYIEELLQ